MLIECLDSNGQPASIAALDSDSARWGTEMMGVPILGGDDMLDELVKGGTRHFICGVGGKNDLRRKIFESACELGLKPLTVRHKSVLVSRWAKIDEGAQLLPACVVNPGARIGRNTIINTTAVIEHDCLIGDHAHVATGARLGGGVQIGSDVLVGAGATVRPLIRIGEGALVGAGAVVIRDVEPFAVVAGVPARRLR